MIITFYSVVLAIAVSSLLVVLIYFFRKFKSGASAFGIYAMLALYLVTLIRLFVPVELPDFQLVVVDYNVYPKIMEFITPDTRNIFVLQFSLLNLLLVAWVAGAVFFTVRFFVKYFKTVKRLCANSVPADSEQSNIVSEISRQLGIKRKIKCIVTDEIASPMTYGFFKPVILFSVYNYSDKDFYYIARHECCHIKNKDIWVKLLVELYCALFWWNPVVYLLKKDLVACLEIKCDKTVQKSFSYEESFYYAQILVFEMKRISENSLRQKGYLKSALIGMEFSGGNKKRIIQRINIVLSPKTKGIKNSLPVIIFSFLFAAIIFASYTVIIQPGWYPTEADYYMPDEALGTITPLDEQDDMYVYVKKDGTYILVFEPYDEEKGVVLTEDNTYIIPKEDIENGYYKTYKFIEEK